MRWPCWRGGPVRRVHGDVELLVQRVQHLADKKRNAKHRRRSRQTVHLRRLSRAAPHSLANRRKNMAPRQNSSNSVRAVRIVLPHGEGVGHGGHAAGRQETGRARGE